ncbi:DUF134 domain-containing protein [Tindallia californiensis]|uniref:UPF0251 protein SAMN05192546_10278 n=1 Tax=Tindallia californiensis TaxID=159292 RepID=A0A1H3JSM4_9FIRM|nr:DUF134 domain-containing protein [Tindallia californiensis]SDY42358.1 Predicted DNA-binding protein, UPF0251 family [Tindallia californiensis]
MARPKKERIVCFVPSIKAFGPVEQCSEAMNRVDMSIEEFESIRLMDYENLGQETSAEVMGVARSTFQRIYNDARKKIAYSLVQGATIHIEGGNYKLCDDFTGKGHCFPKNHKEEKV